MSRRTANPELIEPVARRILERARPTTTPSDRPVYVVRLGPAPGVDPVLSLRHALKYADRTCGLRAIAERDIPLRATEGKESVAMRKLHRYNGSHE
ncbi:MAG: hypothetical protein K8S99_00815 [Planctomycetes bacterium]|nr:hypothetical protein [Planctomycetota bacterium]